MRNKILQRISQDAVKIRSNKGQLKVFKKKVPDEAHSKPKIAA